MANTTADQANSVKKALIKQIPETKMSQSQIEDKLIRARVNLLISSPFFGNLATRLILKDATEWCPTAGTDGRYFYFNRNFVAALSDKETVFLMGHEVLHCVYNHIDPDRRGDRIHELWNISNDQVINLELVECNIGERITLVDICFDPKYQGMMSEEVYDLLYEEAQKSGRIRHVSFDMHMDGVPGDGDGENESGPGPAKFTESEREQIRQEIQNAMIQAAKDAAGSGNLPAGVKRMVDKLLNPVIDWRELVPQRIQSILKNNYTYMRPGRKSQESGFYMPALDHDQSIDVTVCVDASGSMTPDMLHEILSEIQGIMQQYTDYTVNVWSFDTQVYNHQVFTLDNGADITEYQLQGGGGTDFMCNWEYMKEQGIVPKLLIMFTDMYPWASWGEENYCDTIFVALGGTDIVAPFGITVPYKRS